jgi:hypothetical protein
MGNSYNLVYNQNENLQKIIQNNNEKFSAEPHKIQFQITRINSMNTVNFYFFYIYLVFFFILLLFLIPTKKLDKKLKIIIIFFLIFYPFFIYSIENFIYQYLAYYYSIVVKTIY